LARAVTNERSPVVISCFGVTAEVALADEALVPGVLALLPLGWRHGDPKAVRTRLALGWDGGLAVDGVPVPGRLDDPSGLGALDSALRAAIASGAEEHVFIHAGVVARAGRAIVLPGRSWSGKSTLVAALVRAGAEYLSDEFAVLDANGRVHPFAKPLSVRAPGSLTQRDVRIEQLGGRTAAQPADVAVIAVTPYVNAAEWSPRRGTVGDGALALLAHAVAVRARPQAALRAARRAATDAIHLETVRGEADAAAAALLTLIDERGATPAGPPARSARDVSSG
jgi:hypothetical protein